MDRKEYITGLICGGAAFVMWGLLPLYWRTVNAISPYQIFTQRVFWSFLVVAIILRLRGEWGFFTNLLRDKNNWLAALGPSLAIAINWLLFIWSVNNGFVIEASLGYYINPLVLTLIGVVILKERLNKLQTTGIIFALVGVLIKSISYGQIPFVALTLAISFALYGFMKKKSPLKSLYGLGFETLVVGIPAFPFLLMVEFQGIGVSGNLPWYFWLMIAFSGLATAIPLLLYSEGAKRLPLSVVGFLQYIYPTLVLLLGIFVFGEAFDLMSGIAFGFIWIGLCFFSYSQYRILSKN